MNEQEANQILGLSAGASFAEREAAYAASLRRLEEKLSHAPTEALKEKYRKSLSRLDDARSVLESGSGEGELPVLRRREVDKAQDTGEESERIRRLEEQLRRMEGELKSMEGRLVGPESMADSFGPDPRLGNEVKLTSPVTVELGVEEEENLRPHREDSHTSGGRPDTGWESDKGEHATTGGRVKASDGSVRKLAAISALVATWAFCYWQSDLLGFSETFVHVAAAVSLLAVLIAPTGNR